jgi:hypothetical protein
MGYVTTILHWTFAAAQAGALLLPVPMRLTDPAP